MINHQNWCTLFSDKTLLPTFRISYPTAGASAAYYKGITNRFNFDVQLSENLQKWSWLLNIPTRELFRYLDISRINLENNWAHAWGTPFQYTTHANVIQQHTGRARQMRSWCTTPSWDIDGYSIYPISSQVISTKWPHSCSPTLNPQGISCYSPLKKPMGFWPHKNHRWSPISATEAKDWTLQKGQDLIVGAISGGTLGNLQGRAAWTGWAALARGGWGGTMWDPLSSWWTPITMVY